MKLTIEFDADALIKDIMQNYPEYSSGCVLQCTKWKYEECRYSFIDSTWDQKYTVDLPMLRKGLELFIVAKPMHQSILDAGNWDLPMCDALIQYSIFGELKYS